MPRPTKLTPEVQERICSVLQSGAYLETAASAAGVAKQTVYNWLNRGEQEEAGPHADFKAAVDKARAEGEARNVALIAKAATTTWQAAAWLLERQYPERWGKPADRREPKDAPQSVSGFDQLDQLDELAERRKRASA